MLWVQPTFENEIAPVQVEVHARFLLDAVDVHLKFPVGVVRELHDRPSHRRVLSLGGDRRVSRANAAAMLVPGPIPDQTRLVSRIALHGGR